MSDASTEDGEAEYRTADTDWLANSVHGLGFGFNREQALAWMAAHIGTVDEPLTVDLVEHVGDAQHGLYGWRVETLVRHERVELDPDEFNELRDVAGAAHHKAELILDSAEPEDLTHESA